MTDLVTIQQVRNKSGAPSSLIDDEEVQSTINEIQKEILSHYKLYVEPTKVIEIRDGSNSQDAVVNLPNDETVVRYPQIWKMLALNVQESDLDLEYIQINPERGTFRIKQGEGTAYQYVYGYRTRIKYLSGFMERATTITETTAATIAGDDIVISVDDDEGFSVNDWIVLEGLDGNIEAAKITAIGTNELTVDNLVQAHEDETVITLLRTDETLKQLILYSSCVAVAIRAIGSTYVINTGYSLGSLSTQKGVPWTHWKNNLDANEKIRAKVQNQLEIKVGAMS